MTLLIFFAFPVATIIISIILQKLIKNPVLVAAFIFAVFLIITFAVFDETFLIATLAYTIIAFITALLTCIFGRNDDDESSSCENLSDLLSNSTSDDDDSTNGSWGCGCNRFRRRF